MEKELRLQPRLACLADCVPEGARLADVGTDHAYLPVWLLLHGRISAAIASDINALPLEHARRTAAAYGVGGRMDFRCCPGLAEITPEETDTVAIAGMGGETIIAILEDAPWTARPGVTLLLQPMTKPELLRLWLTEHGYRIEEERLVRDKGVLYAVITVRGGVSEPITMAQAYCGLRLGRDALYGDYATERIDKLRRAAEGLRQAREPEQRARAAALEAVARELEQRREEWKHDNGL